MSLLFNKRESSTDLLNDRTFGRRGGTRVAGSTAMRHSAVWASLRLRADLVSTLPLDVYRKAGGIHLPQPVPPVLQQPGGSTCRYLEWMYSSQVDLDRYGNCFGLITMRDGLNMPARIELIPASDVSVRLDKDGVVTYWVAGKKHTPDEIWHERQYTVAGLPVGLSPIAQAAMSISQFLSAQEFAVKWFEGGAIPVAHLQTTNILGADGARVAKDRFKASVEAGDVFVSGKDWEFKPVNQVQSDQRFLETMGSSATDIARFFGVPGDMIDAAVSGSSVTYANIAQRNLQMLVMHLGPAIIRREEALSWGLLAKPRFVKLNTDALIRMDPQARSTMLGQQIKDRQVTPTEARELDNRAPFTEEQFAEFDRLFGPARQAADTKGKPDEQT